MCQKKKEIVVRLIHSGKPVDCSVKIAIPQNEWSHDGPAVDENANPAAGNLHPHSRLIGLERGQVSATFAVRPEKKKHTKLSLLTLNPLTAKLFNLNFHPLCQRSTTSSE